VIYKNGTPGWGNERKKCRVPRTKKQEWVVEVGARVSNETTTRGEKCKVKE